MSLFTVLVLLAAAAIVAAGCQVVGRSAAGYEWAIGMVAAVYGELLGFGMVAPRIGGGLSAALVSAIVAGAVAAAVLVLVFRNVGSPLAPRRQRAADNPVAICSRRVRLQYAPALIETPVVAWMRTRFGVCAKVKAAEIHGGRGWVDLELSGTPAAVDAAMDLARQSGVRVSGVADEPAALAVVA